jgi:Subtilase family
MPIRLKLLSFDPLRTTPDLTDAPAQLRANTLETAGQHGGYVQSSQKVDLAAWENKDMLILFAAGNEGADENKNGVVDPDSIGRPGTAKNVLTVGTSEDEHPTFPAAWTTGYGYAAPIVNTLRADNRNGMAAFSSRGPTDDGRIKPDVVAPGTQVVSVRTQKNAFESTVESNSGSFTQTPLGGGTSAWQIVARAKRVVSIRQRQPASQSHDCVVLAASESGADWRHRSAAAVAQVSAHR